MHAITIAILSVGASEQGERKESWGKSEWMNEWARKCQSFDTEQLSCPLFWMFVPTNNTTLNVYRTPLTNQSIKLVSVWRQRLPTPLSTRYKTQCINTVSISRQLSSECFLCAIFIVVIFRVRISIRYLQSTKFWVLLVCSPRTWRHRCLEFQSRLGTRRRLPQSTVSCRNWHGNVLRCRHPTVVHAIRSTMRGGGDTCRTAAEIAYFKTTGVN